MLASFLSVWKIQNDDCQVFSIIRQEDIKRENAQYSVIIRSWPNSVMSTFLLGNRIPYPQKRVEGLLPLYFIKPPIVLSKVGKTWAGNRQETAYLHGFSLIDENQKIVFLYEGLISPLLLQIQLTVCIKRPASTKFFGCHAGLNWNEHFFFKGAVWM